MKPCLLNILLVALPLFSQTPAAPKLSFDVASVKPSVSRDGYMDATPGGRFIATGIPLRMLITDAYRLRGVQVIGGPGWLDSDRWDIEGRPKAEDAAPAPPAKLDPAQPSRENLMLQSLLEDRFQFKFHWEKRELGVYELTVAKGGPKFKESNGVPAGRPRFRSGRGNLEAYEISMATFVYFLGLDRIVVEGTNLKGLYDLGLKWTPETRQAAQGTEPAALPDQPSIFTAIQEQLGLKLEATRSPIEVLVIDTIQKPSAN
jgi:uncharacterized protein (TIGR03435 family)